MPHTIGDFNSGFFLKLESSYLIFLCFYSLCTPALFSQGEKLHFEEISFNNISEFNFIYDITSVDNILYVTGRENGGEARGIFVGNSSDNGISWNYNFLEDDFASLGLPRSIGFFDNLRGIIAMDNHTLRTSDGGNTWEAQEFPCFNAFQVLVINEAIALSAVRLSGNYCSTIDGGETWNTNNDFVASEAPPLSYIDSILFNSDQSGIYQSSNLGNSWIKVLDEEIFSYSMSSITDGAAVTISGNLLKTRDGWASYSETMLGEELDLVFSFAFFDQDTAIFRNAKDIYATYDGGASFELIQNLSFEPTTLKKVQDDWFFVGRGLARLERQIITSSKDYSPLSTIVYPNPTNHTFRISDKTYKEYMLFNMQSIVSQGSIANGQIDVANYGAGFYFLVLLDSYDKKTYPMKVVIK